MLTAHSQQLAVGTTFESGWRRITEADSRAFATLTGDLHLHNVDREFAGESIFGGRVAQGMLVLACAVGLLPVDSDRVVAARRVQQATFKRPVFLGESIRVRARVRRRVPFRDGLAIATAALRVLREDSRVAVLARLDFVCREEAAGGGLGG